MKRNTLPVQQEAFELYTLLRPKYERNLRNLVRKMRVLFSRNGINASVKSRVKSFGSYYQKLVRLENKGQEPILTDFLACRVICPFLEDVEKVATLLTKSFTILELEHKGSKHSFREFGYDSIHLLIDMPKNGWPDKVPNAEIVCEIQIRTILQDAWAEVEHELIYKAEADVPKQSIKRKLASLNANLTLSDIIFQEIRDYQNEIRLAGEKRRKSLQEKANLLSSEDFGEVLHPSGKEEVLEKNAVVHMYHNDLDKLVFEALQAHNSSEYDEAIRIYDQILQAELDDKVRSLIHNHRGMAYFVVSEYPKALEDFSHAIGFNPKNFRAYNNRGIAYRTLQEFSKALEDYNHSLSLNQFQTEGYYNRALVYFDMCDYPKSLADCEYVLASKPDHTPAIQFKKVIQKKLFG
ncbi:MAG: (p)ppGpp synthetase [Spirochaetota bacterium]